MKKQIIIKYFILLALVQFTGCMSSGEDEGVLKYQIEYDEEEKKNNSVISLLPNTMSYYFKDGSSKSMMSFIGFFLAAYISNSETKENTILFKLMNEKYYCSTKHGEPTIGFDEFPNMVLEETKETKEIMGLKAKKVHVTFKDNSLAPFDLFYTTDLNVENPNWNNPYRDIKGVPLDFRVKLMGISMHITLREVKFEEVKFEEFSIPEGYNKTTPEELYKTIKGILQNSGK
ncbi:MAG: hypothetical protein IPO21_09755 [Bacteroidales bacterium]|nr:hypothetical protein [Bacteroidales bacterium]